MLGVTHSGACSSCGLHVCSSASRWAACVGVLGLLVCGNILLWVVVVYILVLLMMLTNCVIFLERSHYSGGGHEATFLCEADQAVVVVVTLVSQLFGLAVCPLPQGLLVGRVGPQSSGMARAVLCCVCR